MYIYIYVYIYIYIVKYYSDLKKEILPFSTMSTNPRGHYTKWNKTDTKKKNMHDIAYMWNLKKEVKKVKYYRLPNYTHTKTKRANIY
jgi:hypothetical protein